MLGLSNDPISSDFCCSRPTGPCFVWAIKTKLDTFVLGYLWQKRGLYTRFFVDSRLQLIFVAVCRLHIPSDLCGSYFNQSKLHKSKRDRERGDLNRCKGFIYLLDGPLLTCYFFFIL